MPFDMVMKRFTNLSFLEQYYKKFDLVPSDSPPSPCNAFMPLFKDL